MEEKIDSRMPVFEKISREILFRRSLSRAFVAGITGIDLSGKTQFTEALAGCLTVQDLPVQVIHLDDFHNPRTCRNRGPDQIENYRQNTFNIESLVRDILEPLRQGHDFSIDLTLLDLIADEYSVKRHFSFSPQSIVLLEGVFLFRKELETYLDYRIFIDISFEESHRRALIRDVPIYGEGILTRYVQKYWPAQKQYLAEFPPRRIADMVIDNSDWRHPLISGLK